jgi:mRNA interferase MazF
MAYQMPLRGEVWTVNLDPAQGHEQAKTRPCVVVSNNMVNTKLGISIVVPLTGTAYYLKSGKLSPAMVEILPPEGGTSKPSYSMAHQVRTVSHERFAQQLGTLSSATLNKVVFSVQDIIT